MEVGNKKELKLLKWKTIRKFWKILKRERKKEQLLKYKVSQRLKKSQMNEFFKYFES